MRNLKLKWFSKSVLLFSTLVVLFTSCKKDDEINPDYVGSWATIETMSLDGIPTQFKDIMTFSKSGFNDLGQIYDESTSKYIDFIKLNGTISVSGTTMNVKITSIGVSTFDMITRQFTGTIVMNKEGSSVFNNLLTETDQPKSFVSEYSVSGNTMTIKTDNNNDGDYTDADETTVYTKQ